ncbi:MAG TPA: creatininase family protein [Candidatus Lokiarchaeia archaeon]|nr:creatininase family protein [Candidatus Lokiarchaeia archaeon]
MVVIECIHSRPDELQAAIDEFPAAYIPIGSLEWHGKHLPLGFDGLKAEALLRRVAERLDKGVFFPTMYWRNYDTMNFPLTMHTPSFSAWSIAKQLYGMGFKIIVMVTGHYPAGQVKNVQSAATRLMKKHDDAYAIGIAEQFILQDLGYFGDHAARGETSLGLALFPERVDLASLPDGLPYMRRCKELGIMGQDPKLHATAEFGEQLVSAFVDRLTTIIEQAWTSKSQEPIWAMYADASKRFRDWQSPFKLAFKLDNLVKATGMDSKKDLLGHAAWFLFHKNHQIKPREEG